jgi:hypothetical protein
MPAMDGSLHLGALAIVLTLGYIGLDHQIRRPVADLDPILREITASLQRTLSLRLGRALPIDIRIPSDQFIFDKYTTYLACLLASQTCLSHSHHKCFYFIRRQWDIPLYFYFTRRIDIVVIAVLCISCLIGFIGEAGAELWEWSMIKNYSVARGIFSLYAGTVLWILFTILLLLRLKGIRDVSDRCIKRLEDTVRAITTAARNAVQADIEKVEQAGDV